MNNVRMSLGVMASVTLAASALASEQVNQAARAPTPATVAAVSSFVGDRASNLTVYPTADHSVVFVSYRADGGADHVGLAKAHRGQVVHYTDFTGAKPRRVERMTAGEVGDAQAQARTLLQAAVTPAVPAVRVASTEVRTSAQQQAADLLRTVPATTSGEQRNVATVSGSPAVRGDSQAMARAVLTASTGK